jgi:hypothetical protein
VQKSALKAHARDSGAALLAALERPLTSPQNQDSTDPKFHAATHRAQELVGKLREPPKA